MGDNLVFRASLVYDFDVSGVCASVWIFPADLDTVNDSFKCFPVKFAYWFIAAEQCPELRQTLPYVLLFRLHDFDFLFPKMNPVKLSVQFLGLLTVTVCVNAPVQTQIDKPALSLPYLPGFPVQPCKFFCVLSVL